MYNKNIYYTLSLIFLLLLNELYNFYLKSEKFNEEADCSLYGTCDSKQNNDDIYSVKIDNKIKCYVNEFVKNFDDREKQLMKQEDVVNNILKNVLDYLKLEFYHDASHDTTMLKKRIIKILNDNKNDPLGREINYEMDKNCVNICHFNNDNPEKCDCITDDFNKAAYDECSNVVNFFKESNCKENPNCKWIDNKCIADKRKCIYLNPNTDNKPSCQQRCYNLNNKVDCEHAVDNSYKYNFEDSRYCDWNDTKKECVTKCNKHTSGESCERDSNCDYICNKKEKDECNKEDKCNWNSVNKSCEHKIQCDKHNNKLDCDNEKDTCEWNIEFNKCLYKKDKHFCNKKK